MISRGYAVLSFLAAFLVITPAGAGTLVNTQFVPFSVDLETENAKCAVPDKALGKLVLPAKYTKTKVTFFLLCVAKGKEGDRVLFLGTEERNDGLAIGAWMDTFARGRKDGLPIDYSYSVSDPGLYGQVYAGLPLRSVKVLSGDIVRLPFEQIVLPNSAGKADVYYAPLLINETSTFRGVYRHHGLAMPRDRIGSFEPQIVPKGERRLDGFDDRIVSLYARGMTVREIRGHLQELYGVEVSPDLISRVTDAVLDEVREWQNRPLDPVYPVVFFELLPL